MNHLSLVKHKSKYSADYYLTFAIDGEPLEVWLPKHDPQLEHDLIVSLPELYDEKETTTGVGSNLFNRPRMANFSSIARMS